MAPPPGEDVTDDDQVRARRASRAFAGCHCDKCIGGIGIEALALATGLKNRTPCALSSQLDAVDEGHSRFGRKSTAKADHAEPVAPMAEVPDAHLLAVEVAYVGICLAVLAGFVAQLSEVRAPCNLEQFSFSTWGFGLCLYDLGGLQNRQLPGQQGRLGIRAIDQAGRCLERLAGLAGGATHLAGHPCSPVGKATGPMSTTCDSAC
jgi:hypothetical protein